MTLAEPIPPPQMLTDAPAMRRRPRFIVWALLLVIVGGHFIEIVTQKEHWPFSNYPMWSFPSRGWEVKREMLRGVTDEPTPREIEVNPRALDPMPYQMVVVNMQKAAAALKAGDSREADARINGVLAIYNNRIAAGKNPGPKLSSLRLYIVTWQMDKDASPASKANPIRTELVYPVLDDAQKAAAIPPVSNKIYSEVGDDNGL